tara:strand:+ start:2793 stop:3230 length:438 start_codon:yes stop_codon:yes gene_type:complete
MTQNQINYISIYPWILLDDNNLKLMICKPNNNKDIMFKDTNELLIEQIKKKNLETFLLEILGYIRNNYMSYTYGKGKIGFLDKNDDYIFIFTIDNNILIQKSNINSSNKSLSFMSNLIKNSPNGAGYVDLHNNKYSVLIDQNLDH